MNSIFSSYDAVCAELLGLTVRSSFESVRKVADRSQQNGVTKKDADSIDRKVGEADSPPQASLRRPKLKMSPRFAPELDGLHSFETLVPY